MKKNNRKTTKVTFWRILKKAIKDAVSRYRAEMKAQVEKHKTLSSKSDWSMIEHLVQEINEQPHLKVTVRLNDGTEISLRCYNEQTIKDYEYIEKVVQEY